LDNVCGITIDGAASKDLDDAVWMEKTNNGFCAIVTISNVAKYLKKDSQEDRIARDRLFSIYRGASGCVKPMLPRNLSENRYSLLDGVKREVVSFRINLDRRLKYVDINFHEGQFFNAHRITHADVTDISTDTEHELYDQINLLKNVAETLLKNRRIDGAMAIYDISSGWEVTEEGRIIKLEDKQRNIGYVIVQELMILVNRTMAEYMVENDVSCLFRNHQAKSSAPDSSEISQEIQEIISTGNNDHLESISKRMSLIMNKARISRKLRGHYGLNLAAYAYFTSPIRRYPDLVNLRCLIANVKGEPAPYSPEELDQISEDYNTLSDSIKEATGEYLRKRAWSIGESNLKSLNLQVLSESDLYRVVRVCTENNENPPPTLQNEIAKRLSGRSLDLKTMAEVLVNLGSKFAHDIKSQLILTIKQNPHFAVQLWELCRQKYAGELLEISEFCSGPSHGKVFGCAMSIQLNNKFYSSINIQSTSKKSAFQLATLDCLQQLIKVRLLLAKEYCEVTEVKNSTLSGIDFSTEGNFKGKLSEFCQHHKLSPPTYSTVFNGQPHAPVFETTVSVCIDKKDIISGATKSSTKKSSEHDSAKQWLGDNLNLFSDLEP